MYIWMKYPNFLDKIAPMKYFADSHSTLMFYENYINQALCSKEGWPGQLKAIFCQYLHSASLEVCMPCAFGWKTYGEHTCVSKLLATFMAVINKIILHKQLTKLNISNIYCWWWAACGGCFCEFWHALAYPTKCGVWHNIESTKEMENNIYCAKVRY